MPIQEEFKNKQYFKFCSYGFLKNLRFFDIFLLLYFLENEISFTQIGILYAAREITTNLLEVPSGICADRFGRKKTLALSLLISIFCFTVFLFSNNYLLFLFAILLMGAADAFRSGTHKGMIMSYLKLKGWEKHKINYYGYTRSWSQRGSALSALISGILIYYTSNIQLAFAFAIIPYIINIINILNYPQEINFAQNKKENTRTLLHTFKSNLTQPKVIALINLSALHSAYLKAIKDYIQPMIVGVSLAVPLFLKSDKKDEGLYLGVFYFIIYLLSAHASRWANSFKEKTNHPASVTLFIGLMAGSACGLLYFNDLKLLSILCFVFIFLIENLRKPILTGFIAEQVPGEIFTSVISAESLYKSLIVICLSLSMGLLSDHFGIGISLTILSITLLLISLFMQQSAIVNKSSTR